MERLEQTAERARSESWPYEQFLETLLEAEVFARDASGARMRIRHASFPALKTLDDFDWSAQPSAERPARLAPGAARLDRGAGQRAKIALDAVDREVLARAFGGPRLGRPGRSRAPGDAEVVLLMGIPGAGKSRLAETYVARGYVRLNRDERGGRCARSRTHWTRSSRPACGRSCSTIRTSRAQHEAT